MGSLMKEIGKWQKQARKRMEDGVCVVEGIRMFDELRPEEMKAVVISEHFQVENEAYVRALYERLAAFPSVRVLRVTDAEFRRVSDTMTPQGILAVAARPSYSEEEILNDDRKLIVLLEGLSDPGNLGTIFRSGEAAGISGVIMDRNCVDATSPKVIRATMGSFFRVPFAVTEHLEETLEKIRERGGRSFAAHLQGSEDYALSDYSGLTAFLIGNEARGLSEELTKAADCRIRIPMQGRVESLNAAMAASILLFEAARQRRA